MCQTNRGLFGHDRTPNFWSTIFEMRLTVGGEQTAHSYSWSDLLLRTLVLQNWVPQIHILYWQQSWLRSPNLGRLAGSCCGGEASWREMELSQKCSSSAASFHDLEWKYSRRSFIRTCWDRRVFGWWITEAVRRRRYNISPSDRNCARSELQH